MVPHFIIIHLSKWKKPFSTYVHLLLIFILIFSLCVFRHKCTFSGRLLILLPVSFKVASEDGKMELGNSGCVRKSKGLDYPLMIRNWGSVHHAEIWHEQKADQIFNASDLFKTSFFFFIIKIQVLSPLLSTYAPDKWNFAFSHYHFSKIQQLLLMLLVKPAIYCI